MKRNLLLIFGLIVAILLVVNSTKRLMTFRTTSQKVEDAQKRLEKLKEENTELRQKLEYTKTQEFREKEIRDKLGLAKPGEAVVILPKDDSSQPTVDSEQITSIPNYIKWWNRFFGG